MDSATRLKPHDRLIKYTFGQEPSAAALLDGYVPETMRPDLELNVLEVVPGSFVDPQLSELHTDLLYKVRFKKAPLYMYCLFEHQSTPDPWIGARILGYKSAIWRKLSQAKPKPAKLPPIYVLVVYSGKERWTAPLRWSETLEFPQDVSSDFLKMEVNFEYQLIDLSQLSPDEIRGDVAGRLTLSLMKAAVEDRVLEWLKEAAPLLKMLREEQVTGMFEVLLRYLLTVDTSVSRENIFAALEQSQGPELTRQAMSIADQLIAEGVEKGKVEGRLEGRVEGAQFGVIRAFQEMLGLPQNTDEELSSKSEMELKQLANELRARFAKA